MWLLGVLVSVMDEVWDCVCLYVILLRRYMVSGMGLNDIMDSVDVFYCCFGYPTSSVCWSIYTCGINPSHTMHDLRNVHLCDIAHSRII